MKILIVTFGLTPGGAERQVIQDANSLCRLGDRVTVAYQRMGPLANLLDKDIRHFSFKWAHSWGAAVQLWTHLLKNRYDAIHCHMLWGAKVSLLPAWLTRHRVIVNEHGLGLWRRWYHRILCRFNGMLAFRVITPCQANSIIRRYREHIPDHKLAIVYNGLPEEFICIDKMRLKEKIQPEGFILGFVGRLTSVKQLHLLIPLISRLKDQINPLRMVVVGTGPEEVKLRQAAESDKLTDYFEWSGYVSHPQNQYHRFDIFLLPSKREAFSMALLEANACGIPAIAFDVGGNGEIIQDGYTGYLLPKGDLEGMALKILELYNQPALRIQMGNRAKERIKNHFSMDRRISQLRDLYH